MSYVSLLWNFAKIAICPESLGNFEESAKRNQNVLDGGEPAKTSTIDNESSALDHSAKLPMYRKCDIE